MSGMSVAHKLPGKLTVAEFLALLTDGTGSRYELVEGEVRAQDAASGTHGTIHDNLGFAISSHLRAAQSGCRLVHAPGIQPQLRADWNWRVPEMAVTCAKNEAGVHNTPAPLLLVEILSPSNEKNTWSNILLYFTLPSVMEILVVDSTKVAAEVLRRDGDGRWPQKPEVVQVGGTIHLASIGLELPLAEVYRGTHLA